MLQLALAAAFASPLVSAPAAASRGLIAPPTTPMRYRRLLEREMAGGAIFQVVREFAVSFEQFQDGFVVQGRQISAAVSAPQNLDALARLEEARDESNLFPLALNPLGMITTPGMELTSQSEVQAAFVEAERLINSFDLATSERDELNRFIATIHQTGAAVTAQLPIDLFSPQDLHRNDEQTFALPTGEQGHVRSRFEGERDEQTGLMRRAIREVITQIAQDRRLSREEWQLLPA